MLSILQACLQCAEYRLLAFLHFLEALHHNSHQADHCCFKLPTKHLAVKIFYLFGLVCSNFEPRNVIKLWFVHVIFSFNKNYSLPSANVVCVYCTCKFVYSNLKNLVYPIFSFK